MKANRRDISDYTLGRHEPARRLACVVQVFRKLQSNAVVADSNPAFDVTPHYYISAIITERGILQEPYETRLRKLEGGMRH